MINAVDFRGKEQNQLRWFDEAGGIVLIISFKLIQIRNSCPDLVLHGVNSYSVFQYMTIKKQRSKKNAAVW